MHLDRSFAIDFDGTLFTDKWPDIGEPIWRTINLAKKMKERGAELILWTCRTDSNLDRAIEACEGVGLIFDRVNCSSEKSLSLYGNDPRKISADEFWDDRAVSMPLTEEKSYWIPCPKSRVLMCEKCEYEVTLPSRHCPMCDAEMLNFRSAPLYK